ncbi:MAG: LysR substrate-binding domain-containing protein [Gammaproteobacteria bacterium]|nr:LysR substrate-binding domain-containing protein [Gammaproteobacteria bacterium]MDH5652898.1 LysR substrate-binding domain-containing protein [Gammaproteobacteria bacterium]
MNLRDLQYVIAVAETHHFGKAAERCYVSQPTLSGQIKKLEDELGVTLFERTNRSVEITPIGTTILNHARHLMDQAEAIRQAAQAWQDPLAGPLRIGAIPTLSPYLMPLILVPLRQQHPQLKLVLSEEMTHILLDRLRRHEIDAALLATPVEEPDLAVMPLFDEPFWLAHPADHPFYHLDEISQADLDNTQLLLLSEGHCLADQAMAVCHLKERPETGEMADLRAASLETLLQLVSAGFGSTLVPALALGGSWSTGRGIVTRKLDIPNASRRVSLVYRQTFPRKAALEAFAAVIHSHLPNTVRAISNT